MKGADLSAYLVLDHALCGGADGMVATARAAAANGATVVQLRLKDAATAERVALGRRLRAALAGTGVPLIVNDDAAAMREIGADGLHVGQDDIDPAAARAAIGPGAILGLSVEDPAAAARLDPAVVDYAGVGPVFATPVKPDHKPPIGPDGLARLIAMLDVPTVAIGGLQPRHAPAVLGAGADGMAVVSAICGQPDPGAATARLVRAIADARRGAA